MDTSAAPMAPMTAAALPPPGVGLRLARSSRNFSTETSIVMMWRILVCGACIPASTDHRLGDGVNFFRIEQQIVLLEEASHAGAMQRQLEGAEAERAEEYLAVFLRTAIALAHAFDSRRRRGIGIGHQFQCSAVLPLLLLEQRDARGARR